MIDQLQFKQRLFLFILKKKCQIDNIIILDYGREAFRKQ